MALIKLTNYTAFNRTDGVGILLDGRRGCYFELDPCQTLLLTKLLETSSLEEAATQLMEEIEAEKAELLQALEQFCLHLETQGLVQRVLHLEKGGENKISDQAKECVFAGWDESAFVPPIPQQTLPVWQLPTEPDWEFFLTGQAALPPLPSISPLRRLYAASHAIRILLLFSRFSRQPRKVRSRQLSLKLFPRTGEPVSEDPNALSLPQPASSDHKLVDAGLGKANWYGPWLVHVDRYLRALDASSFRDMTPFDQQRLARREIVYCQVATRLVTPRGRCVPRSLALCAYLRAIGLPARFVMERAQFSFVSDEFHAWAEVGGHAVNESDEIRAGYSLLQCLPSE